MNTYYHYIPTIISMGLTYGIPRIDYATGYNMISTAGMAGYSCTNYLYNLTRSNGSTSQITNFETHTDHVELQENTMSTIDRLKESVDIIERKQLIIDSKIIQMIKEAINKNKIGNKKSALFALKRKKLYEKELNNLDSIRSNLELKIMNLETLLINLEVFSTLRLAATQMKTINHEIDIDSLDNTLDDLQEGLSITDEISSILTQPIVPETFDEDELMDELNEILNCPEQMSLYTSEEIKPMNIITSEVTDNWDDFPDVPNSDIMQNDITTYKQIEEFGW